MNVRSWTQSILLAVLILSAAWFLGLFPGVRVSSFYGSNDTLGVVIPPKYDLVRNFHGGYAAVRYNGKWGYVDRSGDWQLRPRYEAALDFHQDRAPVREDKKWGYVDSSGRWIVEPRYSRARDFSQSRAAVKKDGRWAFLNPVGDTVTSFRYTFVRPFKNGLAAVREDNRMNFINRSGSKAFEGRFEDAGSFSEGFAPVERNDLWGYVNRQGELVEDFRYKWASSFRNGHARVLKKDGWHLLDRDFSSRSLTSYELVGTPGESLIPVIDDRQWGFVDSSGTELNGQPRFDGVVPASKEPAPVRREGKWGYVNAKGTEIKKPRYDAAGRLVNGRARVKIEEKWGYLGRNVTEPREVVEKEKSGPESKGDRNLPQSLTEQYPRWFREPGQRYVSIGRGTLERRWHLESTSPTGSYGFDEVLYEVTKYPYEFPDAVQHEAAEELYFQSLTAVETEGWLDFEGAISDGYEGNKHDATHFHHPEHSSDSSVLVPSRPEYLIYYGEGRNQHLKGIMYLNASLYGTGPQIGGPLTLWHYHRYTSEKCFRNQLIIRHEAENCPEGKWQRRAPEMLHIWFMEHPQGSHGTRMEFLSAHVPRLSRDYRPRLTN